MGSTVGICSRALSPVLWLLVACDGESHVPVEPICVLPRAHPGIVDLTAAGGATFAVFSDGRVACWGDNSLGDCGFSEQGIIQVPRMVPELTCSVRVAGGVAVSEFGRVRLIRPSQALVEPIAARFEPRKPVAVPGVKLVTQGCHNDAAVYLLKSNGEVEWWGRVWTYGGVKEVDEPTTLLNLPPAAQLALGSVACALSESGEVWCWGRNLFGELGDPGADDRLEPQAPIPGLVGHRIVQIAFSEFGCALDEGGRVWCWGRNDGGQLGRGFESEYEAEPVPIGGLPKVAQVEVSIGYACALTDSAEVLCWGVDLPGFGTEPEAPHVYLAPVRVSGGKDVLRISTGGDALCMLKVDGSVWCLANPGFQGVADPVPRGTPVKVDFSEVLGSDAP